MSITPFRDRHRANGAELATTRKGCPQDVGEKLFVITNHCPIFGHDASIFSFTSIHH